MKHQLCVWVFASLIVTVGGSVEATNEHVATAEIPLSQIWAYQMPGTRDVRELEPKADPKLLGDKLEGLSPDEAQRRMIDEFTRRLDRWKILKTLGKRPTKAAPTFVVTGAGKEALANAATVLSGMKQSQTVFPPDTDLSLVFYSHSCGRYVQLRSVERWSNVIVVTYQFVAHPTMEVTKHFALIPLGRLSEGDYDVKIEQLQPIDATGLAVKPVSDPERIVSGAFSFTVQKE